MHETINGKAPVILGGHEHTVFEEAPAKRWFVFGRAMVKTQRFDVES